MVRPLFGSKAAGLEANKALKIFLLFATLRIAAPFLINPTSGCRTQFSHTTARARDREGLSVKEQSAGAF